MNKLKTNDIIRRGDILLVNLRHIDEFTGSIQSGTRPVIIIQNDRGNKHSTTLICLPLSSTKKYKLLPTHIPITNQELKNGYIKKESIILCEQIATIDRKMVIKKVGTIKQEILENQIKEALQISLGFINAPESA